MAKAPRIGRVKTRLALAIGSVASWSFYRRTMIRTVRYLNDNSRWRTMLAVTPDESVHQKNLWPNGAILFPQGLGGLGKRMKKIMDEMPPGPVIIIGSDIPNIRPWHIECAFTALGHYDAVFGPADDGGYWLVGLKRRPRLIQLFKNVRWSSCHALADTKANLPKSANTVFLETLTDVDNLTSLRRMTNHRYYRK